MEAEARASRKAGCSVVSEGAESRRTKDKWMCVTAKGDGSRADVMARCCGGPQGVWHGLTEDDEEVEVKTESSLWALRQGWVECRGRTRQSESEHRRQRSCKKVET